MSAVARRESAGIVVPDAEAARLVCDRSRRLLTAFGSETLRVDVSLLQDGSDVWECDLREQTLSLWGSAAHVQTTVPMLSVRYAAHWAFVAVLAELDRTGTDTRIRQRVSGAFNAFHRFAVFMARRGITDLSRVARADTDSLLEALADEGSWAPLLGTEAAYRVLQAHLEAADDPREACDGLVLVWRKHFGFTTAALARRLGFPVHSTTIPRWFVEAVTALVGKPRGGNAPAAERAFAKRTLRGVLTYINDLAYIGDPSDGRFGLSFVPFADPIRAANAAVSRPPQSYPNMDLDDVIALLREARVWIDEYATGIVQFYRELGEELAQVRSPNVGRRSHQLAIYTRAQSPRYEGEFGLPPIAFPWRGDAGQHSMADLVRTLQAACCVVVALNHARRHNEIIGEGRLPYGLYVGCLTEEAGEGPVRYELRVYIEKTVRDWARMTANSGVARAIGVLEALLDAGTAVADALGVDVELHRTSEGDPKLFQAVRLGVSTSVKASMFVWHDHCAWLLERAGVDPTRCAGQMHPFRRVFAQVYYYRYENADLRALSQWLGHASIASTLVYVTDPASREDAERIEARHRQVNQATMADVREFGREYLGDCLLRLFEGQASGGGFTAMALRIFRAMSSQSAFPADTPARAKALAQWFSERGYEPEPHPHGTCMAGTNRLSRSKSKCFDPISKQLNKHDASPSRCSGCPHAFVNDGYIGADLEELDRLRGQATDPALPSAARDAAHGAVETLEKVIGIERRLLETNRMKMNAIYTHLARTTEHSDG